MGNSSEYHYGPVQDYSIKSNMYRSSSLPNRGWTWGTNGQTPIAALRTDGTFQIKKDFITEGKIGINNTTPLSDIHIYSESTNSRIKFEQFTTYQGNKYLHQDILAGINQGIAIRTGYSLTKNSEATMNTIVTFTPTGQYMHNKKLNITGTSAGIILDPQLGNLSINSNNFELKESGFLFARRIEVIGSGNFPDYVFDADYDLRTLDEVEAYIKANHHLPDVPSAEEVAENGHNLGEMDEILLKKVEELTLYMIQLKKENEELKSRLNKVEENEK